jgi:hypothetical protein
MDFIAASTFVLVQYGNGWTAAQPVSGKNLDNIVHKKP